MMLITLLINGAPTVVSIGVNPTFKVIFTPLEYVPTKPSLSTYIINICFVLFKQKEGLQHKICIRGQNTNINVNQLHL